MAQAVSVTEVMTGDFLGVTEGESVSGVADLLQDHRSGAAVVMRGSRPVGLVTATDLLAAIDGSNPEEAVDRYMHGPVVTVPTDATIGHAADRLLSADTPRLVVVDADGAAIGVIGPEDVLSASDTLLEPHLEHTTAAAEGRAQPRLSEQGVCESCGALVDSLTEVDGTLLCAGCADL